MFAQRAVNLISPTRMHDLASGVPYLLREKWKAIKGFLTGHFKLKPFTNQTFRLGIDDETIIASMLEEVASCFGNEVSFGSYPVRGEAGGETSGGQEQGRGVRNGGINQILLTMDSKDEESVDRAAAALRQRLPAGSILKEERNVTSLLRKASLLGVASD